MSATRHRVRDRDDRLAPAMARPVVREVGPMTAVPIAAFARSQRRGPKRLPDSGGSTARFSYVSESSVAAAGVSEPTVQRGSRMPDASVGEVLA
ncbi:hypothetical protein ACQP0C_21815 [Nocardia sp. CA-129566]|uniref:hypothetical protein n=1 Tax=Nocardia sp. CA-129566 TaxID=3239976 RepID=UPI003D985DF0